MGKEHVTRWRQFLADTKKRRDPAWLHWHAVAEVPEAEFAAIKMVRVALRENEDTPLSVEMAGVVGQDLMAGQLCDELNRRGVATSLTLPDATRPTTTKTRISASSQQSVTQPWRSP